MVDVNGFVKQTNPKPFHYSESYAMKQATNTEMAHLRLGYTLSHVPYDALKKSKVLELGPGNGLLLGLLKRSCARAEGYDVSPRPYPTLEPHEAISTEWDGLVACDVIEHFHDIDHLWSYRFKWAYISVPFPPAVFLKQTAEGTDFTTSWRHFKPDEHVYYLSAAAALTWFHRHGYEIMSVGCPEDLIRTRWEGQEPNICTFFIRRHS